MPDPPTPRVQCVRVRSTEDARSSRSPSLTEYRRANPHMRGTETNGALEIGAHAHAESLEVVLARDLGEQREMRRGRLINRRNAHQPKNRQLLALAAEVDEMGRVERQYAGFLDLFARVHLDEQERPP